MYAPDSSKAEISVIVPVYNTAPYLEECVRSLMEQSLESLEFIFIDDASSDNSLEILKNVISEYPDRQKQIKIIEHQENKGISFTRQEGVKEASGNWVIHCDSDDYIEKDTYRLLLDTAKEKDAQIVVCGYQDFSKDLIIKKSSLREGKITPLEMMKGISGMAPEFIHGSLWNKLIKKELWDNIRFPEDVSYCEDEFALFQILSNNLNLQIYILPKVLYNYRIRENSLVKRIDSKRLEELRKLINLFEQLRDREEIQEKRILNTKITSFLYRLIDNKFDIDIQDFSRKYRNYEPYVKLNNRLRFSEKLQLRVALKGHKSLAFFIRDMNIGAREKIKRVKTLIKDLSVKKERA